MLEFCSSVRNAGDPGSVRSGQIAGGDGVSPVVSRVVALFTVTRFSQNSLVFLLRFALSPQPLPLPVGARNGATLADNTSPFI